MREQEVKDQEEDHFEEKWRDRIDVNKCMEARPGDHLLAPFECEICVFLKLKGRHPMQFRDEDRLLCETLRRANLDVFWSRERATVANTVSDTRKLCKMSKEAGLKGPFVSWEPIIEWNHCGY